MTLEGLALLKELKVFPKSGPGVDSSLGTRFRTIAQDFVDARGEEAFKAFSPENVTPAALFLVSDEAPSNAIVGAGAGVFQSAFVTMNEGVLLSGGDCTVEGVAANWAKISDRSGDAVIQNGLEQSMHAMGMLQKAAQG